MDDKTLQMKLQKVSSPEEISAVFDEYREG